MTENTESSCLNNNSLIPALNECERFIEFLNTKFNLNLPDNYLITINKASKSATGFFMNKENQEHFTNSTQDLNNINLNTYYLKTNSPYECLAHELAHFLNYIKGVKGTSSNQYHNKNFKEQAETLLLSVERTKKGYSQTEETEEFKQMLEEFKPEQEVFNIFQNQKEKNRVGSRMKLYVCSCNIKIRCATELKAVCLNCNTNFEVVE